LSYLTITKNNKRKKHQKPKPAQNKQEDMSAKLPSGKKRKTNFERTTTTNTNSQTNEQTSERVKSKLKMEQHTKTAQNKPEEMSAKLPLKKKRKKNPKSTTAVIKKPKLLQELDTDALQCIMQFLSLNDRAKHVALTCKRFRTIHNFTQIHYKFFGPDEWQMLHRHSDPTNLAKRFRIQILFLSPLYDLQLMSVLTSSAQPWLEVTEYQSRR